MATRKKSPRLEVVVAAAFAAAANTRRHKMASQHHREYGTAAMFDLLLDGKVALCRLRTVLERKIIEYIRSGIF